MPELEVQTPPETKAPSAAPKLAMPAEDAAREIQNQLKIGRAIAAQRIRNRWELDHARAEKQEWVGRTTDLLVRLFGGASLIADQCNDWVATILPEYAELDQFVELFQNEMKHRMDRLRTVLKQLPQYEVSATMSNGLQIELNPTSPSQAAPVEPAPEAQPAASSGAPLVLCAETQARPALFAFLDSLGVRPIVIDTKVDSDVWQLKLARELRRAGVPVDLNKLA